MKLPKGQPRPARASVPQGSGDGATPAKGSAHSHCEEHRTRTRDPVPAREIRLIRRRLYWPDQEGRRQDFGVDFPNFPGCVTAGATLDEPVGWPKRRSSFMSAVWPPARRTHRSDRAPRPVCARQGLFTGGGRIRTFRPSPDQCLSELVEPCAEGRSLDKSSLGRDCGRTAGFAPLPTFEPALTTEHLYPPQHFGRSCID